MNWLLSIFLILFLIFLLILYLIQEIIIFYPQRLPHDYQYNFGHMKFQEIDFTPYPGVKINSLLFKTSMIPSKGIVLYLHGNSGNLASWGFVAPYFIDRGYDIMVPDYRGYGKSGLQPEYEGWWDKKKYKLGIAPLSEKVLYADIQHIYRKIQDQLGYSEDKIVIYGRSIGSTIASKLASLNNPRQLILESPLYSLRDTVEQKVCKWITPILKYELPVHKHLEETKCPVSIIHGTNDEIVPFNSSYRLAKLCSKLNVFTIVQGGGHNNLEHYKDYKLFLDQNLECDFLTTTAENN